MPKISKNASVTLSLICCGIGFLGLLGGAVLLTWFLLHDTFGSLDGIPGGLMLYVRYYLLLVPVAVANGYLVKLLLLVRKRQVFTAEAVSYLRTISWCCFIEAALCLLTIKVVPLVHLGAAFVAGFLGLVLRVVKNVIEEATALKAENDFTI